MKFRGVFMAVMKTVCVKMSDEAYAALKERAKRFGYGGKHVAFCEEAVVKWTPEVKVIGSGTSLTADNLVAVMEEIMNEGGTERRKRFYEVIGIMAAEYQDAEAEVKRQFLERKAAGT